MTSYLTIEKAAHEGAYGHNALAHPSPAMQDAGNYKKGRAVVRGFPVVIENPRGTLREWRAADGTSGANLMKFHYGYFQGVKGADGDELDVYVGPAPESNTAYVVNQFLRGSFDEHKVMLGFPDQRTAQAGYMSNFDSGWQGMNSCVPCSLEQLKWWMAYGDMSKPLTPDQLPYEERNDMQKVIWDSANAPVGVTLAQLLYRIREHDGRDSLMFDPLTAADILADSDGVLALDALVVPYARLEPRMAILKKVMDRAVEGLSVASFQITEPFSQKGTTNVAAVFELSDGQTLSIFFHNPDVTPKKIMPGDDLISWKWMLNKKDVTIAVAPERGRDLNVRNVALRVMSLAAKNSSRFASTNAKRAERMANIDGLQKEFAEKETTLEALTTEITQLEAIVAAKPPKDAAEPTPNPTPEPQPQPNPEPVGEPVLEAAGFSNVSANVWVRSVTADDGKALRVNINVADNGYNVVKSVTSPGITGASQKIGVFETPEAAVAAAQAEFDAFASQTPEPTPEPHKSELVINALAALGWKKTNSGGAELTIGGAAPGDLNPDGLRTLAAQWDDADRYLSLVNGFDTVFDVDTRDGDAADIAKAFDARAKEWAASTAYKPEPQPEPTPEPTPTAAIDVDSLPAVVVDALPDGLNPDWIVMNAPRPLLGQQQAQGDFAHGRFYVALDPADPATPGYIDRNVKDDAYMVLVADKATRVAMALNTVDPEYVPAYLAMDEGERADALASFVQDLQGKPYGELKALAAKGMPVAPTPTPEPQPEPTAEEEAARLAAEAAEAERIANEEAAAKAAQEAADAESAAAAARAADDLAFVASAAEGKEDFYDKGVTDRLAELAKTAAPDSELAGLIAQAKTAAKQFFIAEFQKKVAA